MTTAYRVLFLGANGPETNAIWQRLKKRVQGLGHVPILWLKKFSVSEFQQAIAVGGDPPLPLAVIYWGNDAHEEAAVAEEAAKRGLPLFPVVSSDAKGTIAKELPQSCRGFQCTFQNQADWENQLVNGVLEALSLVRERRRIFISYRRDETEALARQLFDSLNGIGYSPFLDNCEIIPGKNFQTALMHQLVDSDLLILLDSPGIDQSEWVQKELDQADQHGIGILRLKMPEGTSQLTIGYHYHPHLTLENADFVSTTTKITRDRLLQTAKLETILNKVEEIRAEKIGDRFYAMLVYCRDRAGQVGLKVQFQPGGLVLQRNGQSIAWLQLLPGVPVSQDLQEASRSQAKQKLPSGLISLYYNGSGVDPAWLEHMAWLNGNLPVKALYQENLSSWLGGIP
ncbi:MAG: toll/interleukin-1 receptor domain-containing protein [Magnetococcales bacterium]|nr:toll/interleukin-1 receptor domain-containing protein [Magnetococcales bacterium]